MKIFCRTGGRLASNLTSFLVLLLGIAVAQTSTQLHEGEIVSSSVNQGSFDYYTIDLQGKSEVLTIWLTMQSFSQTPGDADLFLDFTKPPTLSEWDYRAESQGDDAISLSKDEYLQNTTLYVAVYGWWQSRYTIVYTFESAVNLVEGVPFLGFVPKEGYDYFSVTIGDIANTQSVAFSVTSIFGTAMLFVSSTTQDIEPLDATTWNYAASTGRSSIVARRTDAGWSSTGVWYMIVAGSGNGNCSYQVVATGNNKEVQLRAGVAVESRVLQNGYSYFSVKLESTCDLTVSLTQISGGSDLFMSRDTPKPRADTPGVRSALSSQMDHTITQTGAPAGVYHISVRGASQQSIFRIVANVNCNGFFNCIALSSGFPQSAAVSASTFACYTLKVSNVSAPVTFTLTRSFGNPDMYITANGSEPSRTSYTWMSAAYGDDLIVIDPRDPNYNSSGVYWVKVVATSDTNFFLTASISLNDTTIALQESVPMRRSLLQNQWDYFNLRVPHSDVDEVVVVVTPLSTGDPDLYVSTQLSHPNQTQYIWHSIFFGGDSVTVIRGDPHFCAGEDCTYYIGVYGFNNVSYTIIATFDTITQLQVGVPQHGIVYEGSFREFTFQVSNEFDVTISLSGTGHTGLYVTTLEEFPDPDRPASYQWSASPELAVKSIVITTEDDNACIARCIYRIRIDGWTDSNFTLLVATASDTIPLIPGFPQREQMLAHTWKYFSVENRAINSTLSVLVTPLSGDPDVYISLNGKPDDDHFQWMANRYGGDSIDIDNANLTVYYIGIKAFSDCIFNILAQTSPYPEEPDNCTNPTLLLMGSPQHKQMGKGGSDCYFLDVPTGISMLTLSLAVDYGDPDIFVTMDGRVPSVSNNNWNSISTQADAIKITAPQPGRYLVLIFGFTTCSYSLTATTPNITTSLQNGVTIQNQGNAFSYQYYQLLVNQPGVDITFTVTPLNGDPDIFISTTETQPTFETATWASINLGSDTVTILPNDPNYCNQCVYYVSVFDFTETHYTLAGSFNVPQTLVEGVPASGSVRETEMKYYRWSLPSGDDDLTIVLTPASGNPSLYVKAGNGLDDQPTIEDYTWMTDEQLTTSVLIIRKDDPKRCKDQHCVYNIGVYGGTAAEYTLMVHLGNSNTGNNCQTLQARVPLTAQIEQDHYAYYGFDVIRIPANIRFQLSAMTGDPDMYVSSNTFARNCSSVSMFNNEYESNKAGGDSIFIPNAQASTYWVAVYGFTNSSYTLLVTLDNITHLVNGVPQSGTLEEDGTLYYIFQTPASLPPRSEVQVRVSRQYGDPDLYMNHGDVFPTPTSAEYSSIAWGNDEIDVDDPVPGQYILLVYGASATAFSVTATVATNIIPMTNLADGVSVQNHLEQGEYAYYRIRVDRTDEDMTITTTSLTGDPDMYVALFKYPNQTHYGYKAISDLDDSVTIPFSELELGTYYVSVYGYNDCRYTIMFTYNNEPTLQDGTPQSGYVPTEAERYYVYFPNPTRSDTLSFMLTPLSGSAYLFISTLGQPEYGDPTTYDLSSIYPYTTQTITIPPGSDAYCVDCTYFIMVYGATSSNYSITATSTHGATLLQERVPLHGSVDANSFSYYYYDLLSPCASLRIAVTPSSGDPDLYVSATEHEPTTSRFTWSATAQGPDTLLIGARSQPPGPSGSYYIGVLGSAGRSEFTILASLDETTCNETVICKDEPGSVNNYVHLLDGRPQAGTLEKNQMAYYDFVVSDLPRDVTISVSARYGDPDLFVRSDGKCPSVSGGNGWSANILGADSINIRNGCGACRYTIGVYAWSDTSFTLVVSTGPIQLLSGMPVVVTIPGNTYSYFFTIVTDLAQPLAISATALDGDPDLFISTEVVRPNSSSFQYKQEALGSDVFSLAHPVAGRYNIGVLAYNQVTTIAITATNGPVYLVNGQPHTDSIDGRITRLYAVDVQMGSNPSSVLFSINPTSGSGTPVMYLRNNGDIPSPTSYMLTTANASSSQRYELQVKPENPISCTQCQYLVLVTADALSTYQITFVYGSAYQTLGNGQPVSGNVAKDEWIYYKASVSNADQDIVVDVTVQSSDSQVAVVASRQVLLPTHPQPVPRVWGPGPNNANSIFISHNDPDFSVGDFFIGVKGITGARYSITLSTGNILLAPGLPQAAVSSPGGTYFFYHQVEQDFTVTLPRSEQKQPDGTYCEWNLFITSNRVPPDQDEVMRPNKDHNTWASKQCSWTASDGRGDPSWCANCTYFLGVEPKSGTYGQSFTIRISVEGFADLLQKGVVTKGMARSQAYEFYTIYVPKSKTGLQLLVETCTGNADVYVSQNDYQPDKTHFKWHSSETTKNDMISIMDSFVEDSDFYISVFSESKLNSTFTITYNPPASNFSLQEPELDAFGQTSGTEIEVTWKPVVSVAYPSQDILYTVYWDVDASSRVMYSLCGLDGSDSHSFYAPPSVIAQPVTYRIAGLSPSTSYKINVVASDPSRATIIYNQKLGVRTPSLPSSVTASNNNWVKFVVPLVVILLVGIGYLAFRNHKLTKELDIEMHDVPKQRMALRRATQDPARRAGGGRNFDNLLDDSARAVPSDYNPPPTETSAPMPLEVIDPTLEIGPDPTDTLGNKA